MRALAARALIGGVAGAMATLALASVLKRFGRGQAGSIGLSVGDIARGAAAGAALAMLDHRPGRVAGILAGGGLWLVGELAGPEIAIRPARGGEASGAVLLAANIAWGWAAAEAIRELGAD
ncbi:hypothetical protein [Sphingosinicella sp.]|uniref:hypothetical protein n=1 Tax=Sphingosinicella sp. TaxID=1917971 RepID=UPI004038496F